MPSPRRSPHRFRLSVALTRSAGSRNARHGRLMLTVLGGLAKFERELIRARTSEGRERAKANGKSLGRPHKLTTHQQREAMKRREDGEPVREIARSFNEHHATISWLSV